MFRYGDDSPLATTTGNLEALAMYAGQSVGIIPDQVQGAAKVIAQITSEAHEEFDKLNKLMSK